MPARRASLLLPFLLPILLTTVALGSGAQAAPAVVHPAVSSQNWYWAETSPSVNGMPLPMGAPAMASGIPDGDLGVSLEPQSTPDKIAAVAVDLSLFADGTTFSRFVLTAPYDPAAQQVSAQTPDLAACELTDSFVDGPGAAPLDQAPTYAASSCVPGTFAATTGTAGGFTFDLTAIARDWAGGAPNDGVLIIPAATQTAPFSVALIGKNGLSTDVVATQPAAAAVPLPTTTPPAPAPVFAPQVELPPPIVSAPTVPQPVLPEVPAPVVVAPAPTAGPVPTMVPVASNRPLSFGSLVPSAAMFWGLAGLLLLAALIAAVLLDPMAPEPSDRRRARFRTSPAQPQL